MSTEHPFFIAFLRAKEILGVDPKTKDEDIELRLRTRYFLLLGRKSL